MEILHIGRKSVGSKGLMLLLIKNCKAKEGNIFCLDMSGEFNEESTVNPGIYADFQYKPPPAFLI